MSKSKNNYPNSVPFTFAFSDVSPNDSLTLTITQPENGIYSMGDASMGDVGFSLTSGGSVAISNLTISDSSISVVTGSQSGGSGSSISFTLTMQLAFGANESAVPVLANLPGSAQCNVTNQSTGEQTKMSGSNQTYYIGYR